MILISLNKTAKNLTPKIGYLALWENDDEEPVHIAVVSGINKLLFHSRLAGGNILDSSELPEKITKKNSNNIRYHIPKTHPDYKTIK